MRRIANSWATRLWNPCPNSAGCLSRTGLRFPHGCNPRWIPWQSQGWKHLAMWLFQLWPIWQLMWCPIAQFDFKLGFSQWRILKDSNNSTTTWCIGVPKKWPAFCHELVCGDLSSLFVLLVRVCDFISHPTAVALVKLATWWSTSKCWSTAGSLGVW